MKGSADSDVLELRVEKDVSSFPAGEAIVDQQPFYNFLSVFAAEVVQLA